MPTIDEIRKQNLARLAQSPGLEVVAQTCGISAENLDQILKGTLLPKKKDGSRSPRGVGNGLARIIDEGMKLGVGWMDTPHDPIEGTGGKIADSSRNVTKSATVTLLPAVDFQEVNMSQQNDLVKASGIEWLNVPGEYSNLAKITRMPDSSMFPEIWPGEYVAFDPKEEPDTGDTVMVCDPSGRIWIRKYREGPNRAFEAFAVNPEHMTLNPRDHDVRVIAVLVGHWRGRRTKKH